MDLDVLPGIEYWGARRIDKAISADAAGGALAGIVLSKPLEQVAIIISTWVRHEYGLLAGHVAWYAGWLVTVYLAFLMFAHWKTLDEVDDE